ncbi:MAG: ElyC/SanA/YdcF family protein [Pseudanabaenaceae cyanobacterium SKYGB_i_bin29]|nr:YdcF family protein [Pseudanabaenaceae cyanobacterium SKYG29]MDW8420584.1 ElyC/SanA/YdcF family protein [Pseudanabaenaceae cyanobacterium SKYGB_i_bin29]
MIVGQGKRLWYGAMGIVISIGLLLFAPAWYVNFVTQKLRHTQIDAVEPTRVGIVFGAGVYADGTPTPMLADRLDQAIALYQQGKIQKILMSGDNGSSDYDEVTNMQRYAIDRGIPASAITLDYAGFSTYDTCYRARVIFGVEAAILLSQSFHLPRAVYTCQQLGIRAQGLGTNDELRYNRSTLNYYQLRETMATIKALWQIHITHAKPRFLGKFEGIK